MACLCADISAKMTVIPLLNVLLLLVTAYAQVYGTRIFYSLFFFVNLIPVSVSLACLFIRLSHHLPLLMHSHHGLRGSASSVLTATGFANGKLQFSISYTIDTPQPITKQYVGDLYSCAKFGAHPSTGSFWANGEL